MNRNRLAVLLLILILSLTGELTRVSGGGEAVLYLPLIVRMNEWFEVGEGSASGGGISSSPEDSREPSIAIAPNGTPYVAWQDDSSGNREIYVWRWSGGAWEEVGAGSASGGGISSDALFSETPAIAISDAGDAFIAWVGYTGVSEEASVIYVRWWNGSGWVEAGAGSASGGGISQNLWPSLDPSIAIGPDGTVYVAWTFYTLPSGDSDIYVRKWNGVSWVQAAAGSASGGGVSSDEAPSIGPSTAINAAGQLYVAWSSGFPERNIYVIVFNGPSWAEAGLEAASEGGVSGGSGGAYRPSIAVSPDESVYAAWEETIGANVEIYVRRKP